MGKGRKRSAEDDVLLAEKRARRASKLAMEINLIQFVQERPQLYGTLNSVGYADGADTDNLWRECGTQLNMEVGDVKRFWKNLRDQYFAHRRKLNIPATTGLWNGSLAPAGPHKPRFRHEEAMDFLKEFPTKKRNSSSSSSFPLPTFSSSSPSSSSTKSSNFGASTSSLVICENSEDEFPVEGDDDIGAGGGCGGVGGGGDLDSELRLALQKVVAACDKVKSEEELFVDTLVPKLKRINSVNPLKFAQVQVAMYQLIMKWEQ